MAAKVPTVYQPRETESLGIQELHRLFLLEKAPALIGPNQESIPIPESIYSILLQVIGYMRQGKGVSVVPIMQELTTQQAANMGSYPKSVISVQQAAGGVHSSGRWRR